MTRSGKPDIGILLLLADQEFVRELREHVAAQGFDDQGRSDGFVFRTLSAGPTTISGLAERLEITKQGAGQIVDDMERRGYIERRPDPSDARAKLLHLTEHGQAALSTARKFHQAYERRLRKRFGDEAIDTLRDVLTDMAGEAQISTPHFRALMF
ncbi:DNA-binding MarR family transcriptional regulator [Kribbella rubisoli]|uniref:DNA-binding MarR family transcriptional regulator n=1 Tax=Kribbella rubisoli TaxID=3075929 RepID=A0A4Q7XGW8_9ACTN|nr:MarR family winged helix-turn-helix transcriptional regulator [Kribbella rubisoli]RZU22193.1 DNA-binding MarR family transcriptional regulator [Kribbella rubisoli]